MMETLYLGGYTKQNNKGIHTLALNDDGTFGSSALIIEETNPTYFALSKDEQHLYTLSHAESQPGVAHYQQHHGHYKFIDRVTFLETNGCYLALDDDRQLLYIANYHEGKLAVIKIQSDGRLSLMNITTHIGQGPNANQESAHCHFLDRSPDGYLISCDLGTDSVSTYKLSPDYNLVLKDDYHAKPGTGTRHLTFHPNGRYAYIIGELSNTIDVCQYDDGHLSLIERVNITDNTADTGAAAIRVTSDGHFLYASTRSTDTLTSFKLSTAGDHLTRIQTVSTGGRMPRDFNFNRTEDYVIVGHQESSDISLFSRDHETGLLTQQATHAVIPEIVCIRNS